MILHTRHDDGRADRLGDVIDGTEFQPFSFILFFRPGGQEDHRDVRRQGIVLELLADLVAVHAGHHDVEQNQVGWCTRHSDIQCLLATCGNLYLIIALQQVAHQDQIIRCVVDHQDCGFFGYIQCTHEGCLSGNCSEKTTTASGKNMRKKSVQTMASKIRPAKMGWQ